MFKIFGRHDFFTKKIMLFLQYIFIDIEYSYKYLSKMKIKNIICFMKIKYQLTFQVEYT